ncbi:DUF3987 domain-containing protein [Achromobacter denitrificans]
MMEYETPIHPNGVFPGLLGKVHDRIGDTPKDAAMLGTTIQGAIALPTSGIAKIECGNYIRLMPLCSAHAIIGAPSSGKSFHFRVAFAPVIRFVEKQRQTLREQQTSKKTEHDIWQSKYAATKVKVGNEFIKGGDFAGYEKGLHDLARGEPEILAESALMMSNATRTALALQFSRYAVGGLITAEGAQVLDNWQSDDFGLANTALENEPLTYNRVKAGLIQSNPYLTIMLPVQISKFDEFLVRCGKQFLGSGLGERFLCAYVPQSWVGTETNRPLTEEDRALLLRYVDLVTDLLVAMDANVRSGMTKMATKKMNQAAKNQLDDFRSKLRDIEKSGDYPNCVSFIGKLPDHVLRIAGQWNVALGVEGDISAEYIEAASQIGLYHLDVHRLLYAKPTRERQEIVDSQMLLKILQDRYARGDRPPARAELQNLAFNVGISTPARFGSALGVLGADGQVYVSPKGRVVLQHDIVYTHPQQDAKHHPTRMVSSRSNMAPDRFN